MWFDENGLAINSGKSARYNDESLRLSWTEVEKRIRSLVEQGKYLSPDRAAQVPDNERKEVAAQLLVSTSGSQRGSQRIRFSSYC